MNSNDSVKGMERDMKFSQKKFSLVIFILSFNLYTCNNYAAIQTSTTSPNLPTATTTSIPVPIEIFTSTATAWLWIPYNPDASNKGCDVFTATTPVKETEGFSQVEIAQKLFEIYLEHFQSPELGGMCRLEDFEVENSQLDKRLAFLATEQKMDYVATVQFSVKIKELPSAWVSGNGELAPDGWIVHKFLIIGIRKINDQYVLSLLGTGP